MAFKVSSARPLVSAMRSCDARDRPRTRLPVTISGATTTGISTRMTPMSLALVRPSMHQRADQAQGGAQDDGQIDAGDGLHQRGVGGQARQHLADPGGFVKQRVHAHDAPIDGGAQIRDHPLAQPGHQVKTQRREHAENHRGRQEADEIPVDGARVLRRERHDRSAGARPPAAPACAAVATSSAASAADHHAPVGLQERQQRPQRIQATSARGRSAVVLMGP